MLRLFLFLLSILAYSTVTFAQQDYPEFQVEEEELRVKMEFLASDFLRGRRTGSPGNDIAAAYIAAHLRAYGYETPAGQSDYYQRIPFAASQPPVTYSLSINKQALAPRDEFLILAGDAADYSGKGVFAGHGWVDSESKHDDYAGLDVAGKVVFVLPGEPGKKDPQSIFRAMAVKRKLAQERGAAALIELYQLPFPWAMFANYFGGESLRVDEGEPETSLVYGWLNKTDELSFETLQSAKKLKVDLRSSGFRKDRVYSNNVIGILPGSDPELRDEYVLLSAHFDHVGVGAQGGQYTAQDSIFNGARDNAFGTTALLVAAEALAQQRPKRSIIILAVTGEELGLLGSAYYAEHPLVPLEQTIFNLNTDGAGYNDTSVVSIFGWNRTGTDEIVETALNRFDLGIIADPAPEQNLYDRSDNVSFAKKGVPALTFSPGFKEFDAAILAYYHQVTDEVESLDFAYLTKYCQAFAHTARLLADMANRPVWISGDKYEEAGKALYGTE
jgi:hypothetical protein